MDSLSTHTTPASFVAGVRQKLHIWEQTEEHMLVLADQPDFCNLPPELGGGRANVVDVALVDTCIVGRHQGECAAVHLEGDLLVVACPTCNQFFWIREKRT